MREHDQQFQDYRDFHRVQELPRKLLCTDFEGWIFPQLDFAEQQRRNAILLQETMRRSEVEKDLVEWPMTSLYGTPT